MNMHYITWIFCIQSIIFYGCNALVGREVRNARDKEYTNVVKFVQFHDRESPEGLLCTGTLISHLHILSSEHCFQSLTKLFVEAILRVRSRHRHQRRSIQWWLSYNNWATTHSQPMLDTINDIAIIKINEVIPPSITPAMISFVPPEELFEKRVIAVGYGNVNETSDPVLTVANLKIIPNSECNQFVMLKQNITYDIPGTVLCSISRPFAILISGDSGGPLFYEDIIVGIHYACIPELKQILSSYRANLHVGMASYKAFIDFTVQAE